jgi:phage major head subunit gpT-like protein
MDSVFGKSQAPIAALIEQRVEQFEKNSQIKNIFKMKKSNRYADKYTSLTSGMGFAPVGEGGAYPDDDFQESYDKTLSAETWKDQFTVTKEAIEDDLMGAIQNKAKNFSFLHARSRENFAAHMLWGGIGTSIDHGLPGKTKPFVTTGADGVALFSTAHPSKTGRQANQTNLFANAFSVDALSYVQEKMFKFRDDDGNLLEIMPDTIVIGTSPMLFKAVVAAIGSELDPDTANNATNFQYGLWNVIRWPYLDLFAPSTAVAAGAWFLMDSKANDVLDGAIFQDRVPLKVRSDLEGNDNNVWKGRARYGAGFVDWRPWALSYATSGGTDATA